MAAHRLFHDAGGARIIGLMHDRILAVEDPMIRIGPFDPHAGFVAGDDLRLAKDGLRLIGLDLEPRMGTDEHVHQRALADDQAKGVAEQEAQTLVGNRLKALQINRQRMDARSKWRRRGDGGRRSFYPSTAMCAAADEAPVAHDIGLDRRISISSYSPINSISASGETDPPHSSQ